MDSDERTIFICGISWKTDEKLLREYFSLFGEVLDATVVREKATGRSKGYGFVVFSDPSVIDWVLLDEHQIDGREVDIKRRTSREEQRAKNIQEKNSAGNLNSSKSFDSGANVRTKRIFVEGLPFSLTLEEFRAYFETYGRMSDAVITIDLTTQPPRVYGSVSFSSEDSVDRVLLKTFHDLSGNQVEVKRSLPKDANPGVASSGGGAGAFPVYGGSGGSGYEGHMDSNRYMQRQNTGSGYPPYGAYGCGGYGYPPYGASGYGYRGFSGYGNPAGAPYGNPGVPGTSGPRSAWGAQVPSSYGNVKYGNAAPSSGGPGLAVMEQVGGSAGYGYGGNDSWYGTPSAYGAVDGQSGNIHNTHGSSSGYADASNGSGGYGNHQRNNRQAGYGGSCGKGKQVQQ